MVNAIARLFVAASLLPLGAAARAEVPVSCDQPQELDRYQLLRRLSLDLRGSAPTIEEYEALDKVAQLPAAAVDGLLAGDEFRAQMRRYHELMLWPNITTVRLHGQETQLSAYQGATVLSNPSSARMKVWRGVLGVRCDDVAHTSFDPKYPGEYRPVNLRTDVDGSRREGWREVAPYWAPQTRVKVCAFEAQETPAVTVNGRRIACNSVEGRSRPECGCGPGLRWCYGPGVDAAILSSLREQLGRAVDEVTTGRRPYTDLLLATGSAENGAIAFWRKNLAGNYSPNLTFNVPAADEKLLDKEFLDATWTATDRPAHHAGILTSPAYLLRFQTDRGRANRFRIDFVCEAFVPPAKPTAAPGCSTTDADLTKRCVCQYCHATLEPLAAHFGQFAEAGAASLHDTKLYPRENKACVGAGNGLCARFYVTQPDAHRAGWLQSYQWADLHPEVATALAKGPRALAEKAIADGTLARCTVQRLFAHLVKRELRVAGAEADELPLLQQLAKDFVASGWSFPSLVKKIVALPQYRRLH